MGATISLVGNDSRLDELNERFKAIPKATRTQLAAASGVTREYVGKVLRGAVPLTDAMFRDLSAGLRKLEQAEDGEGPLVSAGDAETDVITFVIEKGGDFKVSIGGPKRDLLALRRETENLLRQMGMFKNQD